MNSPFPSAVCHTEEGLDGNLNWLKNNAYPGRGIIVGIGSTGKYVVQVYWIMGRSPNSQNRIFGVDGVRLFTEAADPSKVKDPSLIIYNAMNEYENCFIVSNGNQTDTVIEELESGEAYLCGMLADRKFEPDRPNFTPRITGFCEISIDGAYFDLAVLRRSNLLGSDECVRSHYQYDTIKPGVGFCITTYTGDGNPLPPFLGEPLPVPLDGTEEEILDTYWGALNPDNRIPLAVKMIEISTKTSTILVRNRFTKVNTESSD